MAYTAAYLDCALENFNKTIVLTGSQLPLEQQGTDAVDNLNLAIKTAQKGYFGVCIAMANRLVPAKTATKIKTEGFDAFESVDEKYLEDSLLAPLSDCQIKDKKDINFAVLYVTPNLKKEMVLQYKIASHLLVLVLGAGGMTVEIEQGLDELKDLGVSIYLKSQCLYGNVESIYSAHTGMAKFTPVIDCSNDWAAYAISFGII